MKPGFKSELINNKGDKMTVTSPIVIFEQDQCIVIFSPTLELYGYGKDIDEAKEALMNNLSEFVNYTTTKGTFISELTRLGWEIKKRKKKYIAPSFSKMLAVNEKLVSILDTKNASIEQQTFALPNA